ncbi:hypothetical protein BRM13313_00113 [Salmonella phage BRM 13313]|nr:hypothetical protein BRM13313_00113 [Salmonella phage BRM 13313]
MANKPTQPLFPLGLETSESSNIKGFNNSGTIEHSPGAVMTFPEDTEVTGLPSSVRYNPDSDEFEGYYENGGWLSLGGGGIRWETLPHAPSSNLLEGRGYLINNTTGTSTVVLPSPTRIGDSVTICDAYGKFATYPLTVSPSGNNLYGSTEDMAITTDNVSATFTWSGPEQGWVITSGVGLGQGRVYSREIFTQILASETSAVTLNTPPTIVDVYADGKRLAESKYSLDGNLITFSPSLPASTELQVIEYTPIQLGNGGGSSSSTITWVYNGGSAIGGETEITLDVVVDDVPAIDINGSRQYKNLGFTFDPLTSKITLAQELDTEDEVVVIINGTPNIYNQIDYTLREVARVTNVKDTEVVYFSVGAVLSGYKVIYDKVTQRSYFIPELPTGTTAVSLSSSAVLVHSAGSVDLGALAVSREEYVTLAGTFDSGAVINTKNELLTHTDGKYRWDGTLPKTVDAGSTPTSTGGVGLGAWVSVGDASLRSDLNSTNGAGIVKTGNGNTVQETFDFIKNVQQTNLHPFVPSGNFGSGLPFDSSLQVFKYNDEYYSYKGPIAPGSIVPATPSVDSNWKKEPISDYIENYGGGVHVADQTPAIMAAISAGVRRIIFPKGELRMSQCDIPEYTQGLTFEGQGANQAYTGTTVIKPLNDNQNCLFNSGVNQHGQDSIKFKNIQFDGEWRCNHAILHESGAGWYYEKLTGKNFNTWVIYDDQGLTVIRDVYTEATSSDLTKRATGGCIRIYSDSVMDTVNCYGGSVPLLLAAGGNRITNIWANGGYDVGAIMLMPKNDSTNHINTAMSNIYIGESTNTSATAIPVLHIQGNSIRRVSGVQISNAHFVHADLTLNTNMVMIRTDKVDGFVMSSFDVLGRGEYSSASSRTYNFLNATDSTGMAFSAGSVRGINNNPIVLSSGSRLAIDAVEFDGWSTNSDSGIENKAAIRSYGAGTRCCIGSTCAFNASQADAYAVYAGDEFAVDISILNLNYPSSNIISPANANYSYMYKRPGGKLTLVNTLTI